MILSLKEYGTLLSTRDSGEIIRYKISDAIKENAYITVDFSGISQMTHSCADEIFGKLVLELGLPKLKQSLKIKNADETTSTIIKYAISRRLENKNK